MNKTATILGFYHFDAFDLGSYKKTKFIFGASALLVFLSLLYCSLKIFTPWIDGSEDSMMAVLANLVASLVGFSLSFIVLTVIVFLPQESLNKVYADHKLKEFDLERGTLKIKVQKDIKANGFFSAAGYWELYFENERYIANALEVNKKNAEMKSLRNKYHDIYSEDETD
jgi:hypothetical protein